MRPVALAAALLFAARAADAAERVVVLEPEGTSDFAWPSGERAVVAELMASDVALVLRPTQAATVAELEREVLAAALEPETSGAVGVAREGFLGFALVAQRAGRSPVRIEDDVRQGPVADGAVALRVSEVLRVRSFDLPDEPRPREPPPAPEEPPASPAWPWIAIAGVATRGASSAAPALALGLRVPISEWLSLEPSGAFTLRALQVDTAAGDVELSARRAALELVLAPTARRGVSGGVAAGGGIAWLSGVPEADAGYLGRERSTEVSVLSLRGFGAWQSERLRLLAFVEVSALLPPVTVRAAGSEVARIGQPWLMSGVALGYAP